MGIAGCHGGMCDSFREHTEWQFMTGGQWVAHPGNDGVKYRVQITDQEPPSPKASRIFDVASEQYYMHVDPAVKVLATTEFPTADGPHVGNGKFDMPQVLWTKMYGQGRVFYNSLGHQANIVEIPEASEFMRPRLPLGGKTRRIVQSLVFEHARRTWAMESPAASWR